MKDKTRTRIGSEVFERKLTIDRASADDDARTVPISLSSEFAVERFFGSEVLIHDRKAINMERAGTENGLPLLLGHVDSKLIGRVRSIKLKDKRLVGVAHFSKNSKAAREAWADVRDEILTDISIRYSIDDIEENGAEQVLVTRWTPEECSAVSVPADATVGINRSKTLEDQAMDPKKDGADGGEDFTVKSFTEAQERAKGEGKTEGATLERARVADISRVFSMHTARKGVNELMTECISKGLTTERAGAMLLEFLAGEPEPVTAERQQTEGSHGDGTIQKDESDKWVEGITEALEVRGGLITDKAKRREARQNEFFGMSLADMARDYLIRQNVSMRGFGRQQIAGQAFVRAGMHGTSDFANVLENVASKAMLLGYDEAPETWALWCRTGSLADFKPASRVNISSFSDLELVVESAEYKEGHLADLKEVIQLAKYGKLFHISRESIINDDLDAFTRIPQAMGRAAARTVGDLAYAVLTSNPTMNQDATTLFHANHGNIGTGGVITETTLNQFGVLMAAQTSPAPASGESGAVLNVAPKYLLVPRAILMTAEKQTLTPTGPDTTGDLTVNTQANKWVVISDARLDADSTAEYYAAADPNLIDTIEVAFLDGDDTPFMDSENGFTQDGVAYKVRIEAAAAALDFRGLAYNAGA